MCLRQRACPFGRRPFRPGQALYGNVDMTPSPAEIRARNLTCVVRKNSRAVLTR